MTEYKVTTNHKSIDVSRWSYQMITDSTNQCPECKSELQHTGGCVSCNCGYTRCD